MFKKTLTLELASAVANLRYRSLRCCSSGPRPTRTDDLADVAYLALRMEMERLARRRVEGSGTSNRDAEPGSPADVGPWPGDSACNPPSWRVTS